MQLRFRLLRIIRRPWRQWLTLMLVLVFILALFAIPNPQTPSGFTSGGLGLTRAEWRQRYHPCRDCFDLPLSEPIYEDDKGILYSVHFWPDGWLSSDQARTTAINPFGWQYEGETAQTLTDKLLPTDAQFLVTVQDPQSEGGFIDIYHSDSLETRYPQRLFAPDPWRGTKAGTIYVLHGHSLAITIPAGEYAPALPLPIPTLKP